MFHLHQIYKLINMRGIVHFRTNSYSSRMTVVLQQNQAVRRQAAQTLNCTTGVGNLWPAKQNQPAAVPLQIVVTVWPA